MNSKTKARISRKAKARISRKAKIRTRNTESSNDKKNVSSRDDRCKAAYKDINAEALTNQLYQSEAWVKPR